MYLRTAEQEFVIGYGRGGAEAVTNSNSLLTSPSHQGEEQEQYAHSTKF